MNVWNESFGAELQKFGVCSQLIGLFTDTAATRATQSAGWRQVEGTALPHVSQSVSGIGAVGLTGQSLNRVTKAGTLGQCVRRVELGICLTPWSGHFFLPGLHGKNVPCKCHKPGSPRLLATKWGGSDEGCEGRL